MPKKFFLLSALFIFIFSAIILSPLLKTALFGDDWLEFYRYHRVVGQFSDGSYNHLTYFFTLYGPMDILFGFLEKIFKYQAIYYHLLSFIFRYLATLSVLLLAFYLTKSKIASLFAALFFSITPIGFDTTNWVFNMTAYLSIACLNLFFYFFLRSQLGKKLILTSGIFYFLANVLAPIRMTGTLLIVIMMELFMLLRNRNANQLKNFVLRVAFVSLISLVVIKLGSFGTSEGWLSNISPGITTFQQEFSKGRFDLATYQLISIGGMLTPDLLLPDKQIVSKSQLLLNIIIPLITAFTLISLFIDRFVYKRQKVLLTLLLSGLFWVLIVFLVHSQNLAYFSGSKNITLLLCSGFLLIFSMLFLFKNLKNNQALAIFLSLNLIILSFFIAWWRSPTTIFETTHRYLIVAASGMSLLLAAITSSINQKKYLVIALSVTLLGTHVIATRIYIANLNNMHSQEITDKIWSSFPSFPEVGSGPGPYIFYFTSDDMSRPILHDVITYGFPPHIATLYNTKEMTTVPMDDWKEVESAVKDGAVFKKYGFPTKSVPINQIHSFRLENRIELLDTTQETRNKLNYLLK